MGPDAHKMIKVISELIKRLKVATGAERNEIICNIRQKFQMSKNEKWVVTKLRMILFQMRADFQYFEIAGEKKNKNGEAIKTGSKKQCSRRSKQMPKTSKPKVVQQKSKRLTLAEKQMNKLRLISLPDDKEQMINAEMSKLSYLKYCGLVSNEISLV